MEISSNGNQVTIVNGSQTIVVEVVEPPRPLAETGSRDTNWESGGVDQWKGLAIDLALRALWLLARIALSFVKFSLWVMFGLIVGMMRALLTRRA